MDDRIQALIDSVQVVGGKKLAKVAAVGVVTNKTAALTSAQNELSIAQADETRADSEYAAAKQHVKDLLDHLDDETE
jgi:hypothetical protein